jgi:hypothetical protein
MDKIGKIKFLIKESNMDTIFRKYRDQIILQFEKEVSEEKYEEVIDFFVKSFDVEKYIDKIIELYLEIYNDEEIDFIYNYYNSEIGKSVMKKTEAILQKSIKFGEEMGEEMLKKIDENYNNWKK